MRRPASLNINTKSQKQDGRNLTGVIDAEFLSSFPTGRIAAFSTGLHICAWRQARIVRLHMLS